MKATIVKHAMHRTETFLFIVLTSPLISFKGMFSDSKFRLFHVKKSLNRFFAEPSM